MRISEHSLVVVEVPSFCVLSHYPFLRGFLWPAISHEHTMLWPWPKYPGPNLRRILVPNMGT